MIASEKDGLVSLVLAAEDYTTLLELLRRQIRAIQRWMAVTSSAARSHELSKLERIYKEVSR